MRSAAGLAMLSNSANGVDTQWAINAYGNGNGLTPSGFVQYVDDAAIRGA